MDFKQPMDELLSKQVDRKEFLQHMGAVILAAIGVTRLIQAFTNPKGRHGGGLKGLTGANYNGGAYGGAEDFPGKIGRS